MTSTGVLAHAPPPTNSYSYICYYPTPAGKLTAGISDILLAKSINDMLNFFANRSSVKAINNSTS